MVRTSLALGTLAQLARCRSAALASLLTNDGRIVARSPSQRPPISNLLLDIANNGTLWHLSHRQRVSHGQRRLFARVDKLARVHAFGGDHGFGLEAVAVWVAVDDFGEGGAAAGVVDDFLDEAADVAVAVNRASARCEADERSEERSDVPRTVPKRFDSSKLETMVQCPGREQSTSGGANNKVSLLPLVSTFAIAQVLTARQSPKHGAWRLPCGAWCGP